MKLGRWSLTRKRASTHTNLVLSHAPNWTLAVQWQPLWDWHWFWHHNRIFPFPDKLGRETRMDSWHLFCVLSLTLAHTTNRRMDMAHRLSWLRWWKKEVKGAKP